MDAPVSPPLQRNHSKTFSSVERKHLIIQGSRMQTNYMHIHTAIEKSCQSTFCLVWKYVCQEQWGSPKALTLPPPSKKMAVHINYEIVCEIIKTFSAGEWVTQAWTARYLCLRCTWQLYTAILDAALKEKERPPAPVRRPSPSPRLNSVLVKSSTPTCWVLLRQFYVWSPPIVSRP